MTGAPSAFAIADVETALMKRALNDAINDNAVGKISMLVSTDILGGIKLALGPIDCNRQLPDFNLAQRLRLQTYRPFRRGASPRPDGLSAMLIAFRCCGCGPDCFGPQMLTIDLNPAGTASLCRRLHSAVCGWRRFASAPVRTRCRFGALPCRPPTDFLPSDGADFPTSSLSFRQRKETAPAEDMVFRMERHVPAQRRIGGWL